MVLALVLRKFLKTYSGEHCWDTYLKILLGCGNELAAIGRQACTLGIHENVHALRLLARIGVVGAYDVLTRAVEPAAIPLVGVRRGVHSVGACLPLH